MTDSPKVFLTLIGILLLSISLYIFSTQENTVEQNVAVVPETTSSASPSVSTPNQAPTSKPAYPTPKKEASQVVTPASHTDYTVIYTDSGFTPQTLQIKSGQSVRFLNGSQNGMWVSSVYQGNVPVYPSFNQGHTVGKGGYYDFTFNDKFTVLYFNLNHQTHTGVISVQ